MKTSILSRVAVSAMLAALLGIAAQSVSLAADSTASADQIRQQTADLLHSLQSYGAGQRDEALSKSKAALANLDQRIQALEADLFAHWDEMDQAAREQAHASLQALREQRTRVAEWYGSMQSSSADAWGHIREGFSQAYQALNEAWEKSEQEFRSRDRK